MCICSPVSLAYDSSLPDVDDDSVGEVERRLVVVVVVLARATV